MARFKIISGGLLHHGKLRLPGEFIEIADNEISGVMNSPACKVDAVEEQFTLESFYCEPDIEPIVEQKLDAIIEQPAKVEVEKVQEKQIKKRGKKNKR